MRHIKGPVSITGWGDIQDADGNTILEVTDKVSDYVALGVETMKVLNAHDAMLDICKRLFAEIGHSTSLGFSLADAGFAFDVGAIITHLGIPLDSCHLGGRKDRR